MLSWCRDFFGLRPFSRKNEETKADSSLFVQKLASIGWKIKDIPIAPEIENRREINLNLAIG